MSFKPNWIKKEKLKIKKGDIIINDYYNYAKFPNYDILKNFVFSFNPHLHIFNELPHVGLSCILKFDIDNKKAKLTDSQLVELLHELIQNVKYATCSNDDLEYIILTSCNNKQNSFHLFFPTLRISAASHQQTVIFIYFKDIILKFNSLYQFDIIDGGIYGKTLFRMSYCTKHNEN